MNRYVYIFLFICLFTVVTFLLFESFDLGFESVLHNSSSRIAAAVISLLLLGVDVVLPIPSSLVMISNGVLFGVWAGGLLSVAGGLLSAVVGYFIGARSKRLAEQFSGSSDEAAARTFLEKYGYIAVIVSRPIPVLAESVAIISGTLQLDFKKVVLSSLVGLVPICLVYSITGAYSASFDSAAWALGLNIGMAALVWFITRSRQK